MSGIVCAIRGGAASQPTIQQAILLARQQQLPLYFLYVVNLDFLKRTAITRVQTISEELREMGEFILLAAQDRAAAADVTAYTVLREGLVGDHIIALCQEVGASHVILGRSRPVQEENVFTADGLTHFVQQVEAETGARVLFAGEQLP